MRSGRVSGRGKNEDMTAASILGAILVELPTDTDYQLYPLNDEGFPNIPSEFSNTQLISLLFG